MKKLKDITSEKIGAALVSWSQLAVKKGASWLFSLVHTSEVWEKMNGK